MNIQDQLHLAALLHDIGKFRRRAATDSDKTHQEHSYEFVTEDIADYFSQCGDTFKNAIRHHHHRNPDQLDHLTEKQVILADRLSATEHETEGTAEEDFTDAALISILSRLNKDEDREEHRYKLTALNFERDTVIPAETADVTRDTYKDLWQCFKKAFRKATEEQTYKPEHYQTIVALLHKYTSRIPSGQSGDNPDSDISLYDHLRTTAAIAACIGRELNDTNIDALLANPNDSKHNICALIKGDISGIQKFLYHILSDGASNQLRGRSFYLQLLTEAIAHWVLRQLELPITNLLLAGGGHFFILAPHTDTQKKFDTLRQTISQKLWTLHNGELYCILDYVPVTADDFEAENFSDRWRAVSENIHQRKQKKWLEMEAQEMFDNLFEPQEDRQVNWQFEDLGRDLRHATTLVTFEIPESPIPDIPNWRDTIKSFGLDIAFCSDTDQTPTKPAQAEHAIVYQLGDTELLSEIEKYQWENTLVSFDFRIFQPVIPHRHDSTVADYDYLANASEGVDWFGALRMDVDNLGTVFTEKLENATISRLATLSEALRLFFEGYVPELCRQYNKGQDKEILELIYAGGDDLFLVGGWSALPDIAEQIRTEFRHFVTGDHVTLSGGIAIEHKKFPLYQFAEISGDAENAAKSLRRKNAECEVIEKDAISFLRKPMSWENFAEVRNWHEKFMKVLTNEKPLPRDILTRLSHIYSKKELDGYRWAWHSIYYFHRLLERNKSQEPFLRELRNELNHNNTFDLKEFIQIITRWTALRIRK